MEIIRGKHASYIGGTALTDSLAACNDVHIDIGTGDGRYVQHLARTCPAAFAIGVDACRENLREASRRAAPNALFVIASAQDLPRELDGLASHVTINFPWGSLLTSLLDADHALLDGLKRIVRSGARIELRLNGGAVAEAGLPLDVGAVRIRTVLAQNGFAMSPCRVLAAPDLRAFPSSWAKRLAFGRDPRAVALAGRMR